MSPTTTVIVTGTHPEQLRICLTHIDALDPAPHEVIVIDDSGTQGVPCLIAQKFPHIQLLQRRVGECLPRQLSRAAGTRDVVAFLDEECMVDVNWLGELLKPYADPDVVGVGGRLVTGGVGEGKTGAGDIGRLLPDGRLTGNFSADPGRVIEVDHLPESNMSFRRVALEAVLTDRHRLPLCRDHAKDISLRLKRAGGVLTFQPRAIARLGADSGEERSIDRRMRYAVRREHVSLLIRVFGWRSPLVRHYARTTVREQQQYLWLAASHMRSHKLTGERRTLVARARGLVTLLGAAVELAGFLAGWREGVLARESGPKVRESSKVIHDRSILVKTVRLSEIGREDEDRWAALSATALEPNPFVDPRFLMPAHRIMGTTDDIRLVVAQDADRWLAVVPLSDIGRFASTPLHLASTAGKFLGKRAPLLVPLVDRHQPVAAMTALLRHLSSSRSGLPGLIELTLLPADGPVAAALREGCRTLRIPLQVRSRFTRAFAEADAGVIAPDHFSSNRRKQLRRKQRSLERVIGAPVEYIDHGPDPAALEALLTLEAAGWKNNRGSIKTKGKEQEWFNRYMQDFLAAGDCRVLELRARDVTLHMSLVLTLGRIAFGTIDAYNEDYKDLSPGVLGRVLEQQTLLARDDIDAFDPCLHPKYTDATALYPGSQDVLSVLIGARPLAVALLAARSAARLSRFQSPQASQRP